MWLTSAQQMKWVERSGSQAVKQVKVTKLKWTLSFVFFSHTDVLKDICIGYLRVKVDPLVPFPLHNCFKCQKYGHRASRCSSSKCALEQEGNCNTPPPHLPKSLNCNEAYLFSSKDCNTWKMGKRSAEGENREENHTLMHGNMYGRPTLGWWLVQSVSY